MKIGDKVKITIGVKYRGIKMGNKIGIVLDIIDDEANIKVPGIWYLFPVKLKNLTRIA